MTTDPFSLDRLHGIPDPRGPERPESSSLAASVPALPSLGPSITRSERRRRVGVAAAVAALWAGGVLFVLGIRADLGAPTVLGPVATLIVFGLVLGALTLRRTASGLPSDVRLVNHALWLVPAVFLAATALMASSGGVQQAIHGGCIAVSTAISLGAGIVAGLALGRSFTSAPVRRGAAVGALVGLSGTIAVHTHCPARNLDHLVVSHGAAILVFALAGAAFGARSGRP